MIVWQSQALPNETARQAAGRFVTEYFNCHRTVKFSGAGGYFRFADGASYYQIAFSAIDGKWHVARTSLETPQHKSRRKGRQPLRPDATPKEGDE